MRGMPKRFTLGEAVALRYLLRERHTQGFHFWQQILSNALSSTNAFRLMADDYGAMINDLSLLKPLKIPDKWRTVFMEMLSEASREIEEQQMREESERRGDIPIIAGRRRTDEELMEIANRL